jgi:hypothetical protein
MGILPGMGPARLVPLVLGLTGCLSSDPGGATSGTEPAADTVVTDAAGPTEVTGGDPGPVTEAPVPEKRVDGKTLGPCVAPRDLGGDPLVRLGQNDPENDPAGGQRTHLEDVEIDPTTGLIYACGAGGAMVFKDTGGEPDLLLATGKEFQRLEIVPGKLLVIANRDFGFLVMDISSPGQIIKKSQTKLLGAAGMAAGTAGRLYVTSTGTLSAYDVDQSPPALLGTATGLGNPWEMVVSGSHGYVADNTLGLVPVDLTDPDHPVVGTPIAAAGSAQDLALYGDVLYLAVGSAGIQVFTVGDPWLPVELAVVPGAGSAVIGVSAANGWLWATDQAEVLVYDLADPKLPQQVASEPTEQFAMAPAALGEHAFVASWGYLELYQVKPAAGVPEVEPAKKTLYFIAETDDRGGLLPPATPAASATLALENQGQGTLQVSGLSLDDPRFSVWLDKTEAAPGETITIWVDLTAPDGQPIDTTLCVATNDPDETLLEIGVQSASSGSDVALGQVAPDFTLNDLNGVPYELSSQQGKPVVLLFFATW